MLDYNFRMSRISRNLVKTAGQLPKDSHFFDNQLCGQGSSVVGLAMWCAYGQMILDSSICHICNSVF